MALPETGVKLVAENESGFLASLNKSTGAVNTFQQGTKKASIGTMALGAAVFSLVNGGLSMIASTAKTAGSALAGLVGQGVSEAAALEAQMSGIAAVTGASADQMDDLGDLIMDLGLNPNLTVSTVEAAQAIEMLGKNGISVDEILGGMALSTVQLANATGADFSTAADLATDTMSLFGSQGVEMSDAVNGITGVVNASKFGINDYALALANGGATAAALGVPLEDFNATITAISSSFTSGATAGTGMKNMMLRLTPSTEKARGEMEALGLITEDGTNAFFDAEGNMKSMSQVSAILSDSLGGLTAQQKASTIKTIFGNDAMEAVLATMSAGAPLYDNAADAAADLGLSFEEATQFIEDGGNQIALASLQMGKVDAADSAATRVDNFAGAMNILDGIIEGVRIQIGTHFLPVLTDLAKKFSEFLGNNSQPFIDFFSSAADFVGIFFDTLLGGETILESFLTAMAMSDIVPEAVSERITAVTSSINNFMIKIGEFVGEHSEAFKGAIAGIGAVFAVFAIASTISSIAAAIASLFTPIGLIVAGAAILGAAWNSNFGGIQEKTQAVIDFITPYINEGIETIKTFWAENGDSILLKASEIWEGVKTAVNDALLFIRDSVIVPIVTKLTEFWTEHGDTIKKSSNTIWEAIKLGIDSALKSIKIIFDAFKLAFQGDWEGFGKKLREGWDILWDTMKTQWDTWGGEMLLKVSTFIGDMIDKFLNTDWAQVGTDIMLGLAGGIAAGVTAVIDAAAGVAQAAEDAARGFFQSESPSRLFMKIGADVGDGLALGISGTSGRVGAATIGLGETAARSMSATTSQIMSNNSTTNNNKTVNFTGNYATQPQITDRDSLVEAMATI